jgi:hypothetical protein
MSAARARLRFGVVVGVLLAALACGRDAAPARPSTTSAQSTQVTQVTLQAAP